MHHAEYRNASSTLGLLLLLLSTPPVGCSELEVAKRHTVGSVPDIAQLDGGVANKDGSGVATAPKTEDAGTDSVNTSNTPDGGGGQEPNPPNTPEVPPTPSFSGSPTGLVHGCARGGYQQNWWDQGGSPSSLKSHVNSSTTNCGTEVPLMFTAPNWGGSTSSMTTAMTSYFAANPDLPMWQFGWEENIKGKCCTKDQLNTLTAQFSSVAAARNAAGNTKSKIAYQMVFQTNNPYGGTSADTNNSSISDFSAFLTSPAAASVDVLAIHPYAWNNYPTPETWEEKYLSVIKDWISKSANPKMQIVYTEGGAPVCNSISTGCTLDEFGSTVRGQGQQENAEYLVKHHVLAFASGVQLIMWYKGGEFAGCSTTTPRTSAEDCFSLTPLTGAAYNALRSCMANNATQPRFRAPQPGVRVYDFVGANGTCSVAWAYDGTTQAVAPTLPKLSVPLTALSAKSITKIQSTTGAAIAFSSGGTIALTPAPIFVYTP